MKKTSPFVIVSLLLTAAFTMLAYLFIYHVSYTIDCDELDIGDTFYGNGVLTVEANSELNGEYLYRVRSYVNSEGDLELVFRGGKQKNLAQAPRSAKATFKIEIPDDVSRVVCDDTVVHVIK